MEQLNGAHFKAIHNALIDGFTRSTLSRMVRIHLEENLYTLVKESNLSDEVDELIRWAERLDKIPALIKAAQAENPSNHKIQALSHILEQPNKPAPKQDNQPSPQPAPASDAPYHSVFISYASHDEAFAETLHADLTRHGVNCWFAPHDLPIGAKIRPSLHKHIEQQSKLLLILSEHSVNSDWVGDEVETALDFERQHKQPKLFPIRIDDAVMQAQYNWAASIRRIRQIGDFRQWQDPARYQRSLQRVLRDLKK